MSDTVYVVHSRPSDKEFSDWKFTGAFRDSRSIPQSIFEPVGYSTTITPLILDQERTDYFRELKYCQACNNSNSDLESIDIGDFKAFVVEAKHDGVEYSAKDSNYTSSSALDNDQIPSWHFDALLPSLKEAETYIQIMNNPQFVAAQKRFNRRIYPITLPYTLESFVSHVNADRKRDSDRKSIKIQERNTKTKKLATLQQDISHIGFMVRRTALVLVIIFAVNIITLISR